MCVISNINEVKRFQRILMEYFFFIYFYDKNFSTILSPYLSPSVPLSYSPEYFAVIKVIVVAV